MSLPNGLIPEHYVNMYAHARQPPSAQIFPTASHSTVKKSIQVTINYITHSLTIYSPTQLE